MIAIKLLLYKKKRFWMRVLTISSLNQPRMKLVRIGTAKKISQVRQKSKTCSLETIRKKKTGTWTKLEAKIGLWNDNSYVIDV